MDDSSQDAATPKLETVPAVQDVGFIQGTPPQPRKNGLSFWLVIVAVCISVFLSALEFTAVSTALPTIIHDLNGDDFVWVGSAYSLAATALLPTIGGMSEIFGRRSAMVLSQGMFALGSALSGAAQNMNWLIAARTVQGAGGGGMLAVASIIVSDLVPLRERAIYNAFIGAMWAIAAVMGPMVGGALANEGEWRWLFYLNLPIIGLAAGLVLAFLKVRTPPGSLREKLSRMDWIGNFLIISSSSAVVIALSWGGVRFPWTSARVLVPLIVGLVGILSFFFYEALVAVEPLVPFALISNRTSISGYIQNFVGPLIMVAALYFLPPYFQACKHASAVRSGVELNGLGVTQGAFLLIAGVSVGITKRYRVQLWLSWLFTVAAMIAMSTLRADSPLSAGIGYPILLGVGSGTWYSTTYFPVLAPLPVAVNARALALFSFCRSFAGVWGVSIGTAVLQTQLSHRLPTEFLNTFPGGVSLAFALIPVIPTLEPQLRSEVQDAFARSIAVIWQVMIGISAAGLVASLFMKGLPLHTQVDKKWGLEERDTSTGAHEMKAVTEASVA